MWLQMLLLLVLLLPNASATRAMIQNPLVLGGPAPNGWTIKYAGDDILDE